MAVLDLQSVEPAINSATGMMAFPYAFAVNQQKTKISHLTPYQEQYKVYSHLELNSSAKYTFTTWSADALVLQSGDSCSLVEGSAIGSTDVELTGKHVAMVEGLCSATLLNESNLTRQKYEAGNIDESQLADVYAKVMVLAANTATMALLATNVAGNLYQIPDGSNGYVYKSGVSTEQQAAYVRQVNIDVDGWITLAIDRQNLNSSLNTAKGQFNSTNNTATAYAAGKAAILKDNILALATPDLRDVFTNGAYATNDGRELNPLIIVDPITFAAMVQDFNLQAAGAALNQNSMLGGGRYTRLLQPNGKGYFYFLDGILIYPETHQRVYEKALTGYQAFMALTVTENICIANSFKAMPLMADGQDFPTAVRFLAKGETDLTKVGAYQTRADFLVESAIADMNYMAIASAYIHP